MISKRRCMQMHLAAIGELMQGLAVQNRHFLFRCNPKGTVLQNTQDGSLRKTSKTRLALSLQHATSSAVPCIAVPKEAFVPNELQHLYIQHSSLWLMYTAIRPHCLLVIQVCQSCTTTFAHESWQTKCTSSLTGESLQECNWQLQV